MNGAAVKYVVNLKCGVCMLLPSFVQRAKADSAEDTRALGTQGEVTKGSRVAAGKCGPDAPGTLGDIFHSGANVPPPGSLLRGSPETQEQADHQDPKASAAEG